MVAIQWPDGKVTIAQDWDGLLAAIGQDQWNPEGGDLRMALTERAMTWSGRYVDPTLPTPQFIQALADTKLFTIVSPTTTPSKETN